MNNPFRKSIDPVAHAFITWVIGDVAFAVIPIATMAMINFFVGGSWSSFLLTKEWSFATIVFLGVSIRKFIRLKVEIQQTPKSYKLDAGVQLHILLLIAAVIVLVFVILLEKGTIGPFTPQQNLLLEGAQMGLFVFGLFSILIAIVAEELHVATLRSLPQGISKTWLLNIVISRVTRASDYLDYAVSAAERASKIKFADPEDDARYDREEKTLRFSLHHAVERLERGLSEGRQPFNTVILAHEVHPPEGESQAPATTSIPNSA